MAGQSQAEANDSSSGLRFPSVSLRFLFSEASAGIVASLCIPLVVLAASHEPIPLWIGRCAIFVAAAACLTILIRKHSNALTRLIVALIFGLLAVGFVGKGAENSQLYIQIAQILIFGTLVSTQRTVLIGSTVFMLLVALVVAVAVASFISPGAADIYNPERSAAIFGNPNVLALCSSALLFLILAVSRVMPTIRHKSAGYVVAGGLACLLAVAGSRGALLMLLLYFGVIALGRVLKGDKRVLGTVAVAVFLTVPVVTLSYPLILGHHIRFAFHSPADQEAIAASAAPRVPGPGHADNRALLNESGLFGVKKGFASGRQIIWPVVIELSGENVFFGHGLGTLPGAYLPSPYNGLSAHNGFLQIYYQFGAVGLLLYIAIWVVILIRALNMSDASARSIAVATLCAALFQEIFEVALIQNAFGIGVALALLITTEFARADRSSITV